MGPVLRGTWRLRRQWLQLMQNSRLQRQLLQMLSGAVMHRHCFISVPSQSAQTQGFSGCNAIILK